MNKRKELIIQPGISPLTNPVATGMIMMRLGYWVWMCVCMKSTSVQSGHYVCARSHVGLCIFSSVCICVHFVLGWQHHTSQVFIDFNDWTFGTTGVAVSWDLQLLTEGVKGMKLTWAFHPDSMWTANQVLLMLLLKWYNDGLAEMYHRAQIHNVGFGSPFGFSVFLFIQSHIVVSQFRFNSSFNWFQRILFVLPFSSLPLYRPHLLYLSLSLSLLFGLFLSHFKLWIEPIILSVCLALRLDKCVLKLEDWRTLSSVYTVHAPAFLYMCP